MASGASSRPDSNEAFPVVVTTYEIMYGSLVSQTFVVAEKMGSMKDREHLSKVKWRYIVVDEGHRLKNLDCKCVLGNFRLLRTCTDNCLRLIRELKSYHSANRLILTGTPLHVRRI